MVSGGTSPPPFPSPLFLSLPSDHQGKQDRTLFLLQTGGQRRKEGVVRCREQLRLLKYYVRETA
jgi:hypothetical protein